MTNQACQVADTVQGEFTFALNQDYLQKMSVTSVQG